MKYSVCIDAVFNGVDANKALEMVKTTGFDAFEFWHWVQKDMAALKDKADSLGLCCSAFGGTRLGLTNPEDRNKWISEIKATIPQLKKMGTSRLIVVAGEDTGKDRKFQRRSVVDGLKAIAPMMEENNIIMVLETLNGRIDHKGTYLEYSDEAFEILDEVGSQNIKLLFDIYHLQISEGNIIHRMLSRLKDIRHIHCAGVPGRYELDIGELNYRNIINALDEAGYCDYATVEYFPQGDALSGLKRMKEYLP